MSTGLGTAVSMGQRPKFIVVFRERSERNISLLSSVRKVGHAPGIRSLAGRVDLASKGPSGAVTKVYERLPVAATDLDENEFQEMQNDESVAAIVPNEIRSIPPIRPSSLVDGLTTISVEDEPGTPPAHLTSPRVAFLEGMSTVINAMRSFEGLTTPGVLPLPAPVMTVDAVSRRTWGLAAIGVTANFNRATGRGVKVAVLDTGVNMNHPDFAGRFEDGVNAVSFVPGQSVQDGHGHGTHCCGVVAGPRTSSGGIRYGVAPDTGLFAGKVLSNQGSGTDDVIIDGITWAADQGCSIISMSLGSERAVGEPFSPAYETIARQLLEEGVLIIAAAGNESDRPFFTAPVGNPAACPSILAVAAVDRQLAIADFSCRQMDSIGEVNVSAPGVGVHSAFKGTRFATLDGTSMATPHVAGCAALFRELSPQLSALHLRDMLLDRTRRLGDERDFGRGLVKVP